MQSATMFMRGKCDEGLKLLTQIPPCIDTIFSAAQETELPAAGVSDSSQFVRNHVMSRSIQIVSMNNHAHLCYQRGDLRSSQILLEKAALHCRFQIENTAGGSDNPLPSVLSNLGRVHFALGQDSIALKCCFEALQAYNSVQCSEEMEASLWYNVGLLLSRENKTSEALTPLMQALKLAIDKKLSVESLFATDMRSTVVRDIVTILGLYLTIQEHQAESSLASPEALTLLKGLAAEREQHGYESLTVGQHLRSLGQLYSKRRDYEYATYFFAELLRVQLHLKSSDADVIVTLSRLGHCLELIGRVVDAMSCFRHALHLHRKIDMSSSPDMQAVVANILYHIGMIHSSSKKRQGGRANDSMGRLRALHSFRMCLQLRRKCLAPKHAAIATVLHNVAILMLEEGQVSQCLEHVQESLSIHRVTSGPFHPDVASSLRLLGRVYQERGDYQLAFQHYNEAASVIQHVSGLSTDLAGVHLGMGQALHSLGRLAEAKAAYYSALTVLRELKDERNGPRMARVLDVMGHLLLEEGNQEEARSCLAESARLLGRTPPTLELLLAPAETAPAA